jgi:hypothetical protein
MQRRFVLLGAVMISACAAQSSSTPAAVVAAPTVADTSPRIVPFRARSVTRKGVVTDDVAGVAEVRAHDIRIILRSGYLELTASSGARPSGVQAVLAYGDTAKWNVRAQGSLVPVNAIRAHGDTLSDIVVLTIPRPNGLVLADHWIALLLQAEVYVPGRGWLPGGFRPIHTTRDIFADQGRP